MLKLDQPLHDMEKALLATNDKMDRDQLLKYRPLKVAVDKAKYYLRQALYGAEVDVTELREYPSAAAVKISHPIILMENHKMSKSIQNIAYDYGNDLYMKRMALVKNLNKTRTQQGSQALSVMWLPDMVNPLEIYTLSKEDSALTKTIKTEDRELEVPRPMSPEPDYSREPKLDMRLAKNRPLKKRPTIAGRRSSSNKKAARMRASK